MASRLSVGARWTLRYTGATALLIFLLATFVYDRLERQIWQEAESELVREVAAVREEIARDTDPKVLAAFVEVEIGGSRPELRRAMELLDESGVSWLRHDLLAPFQEPLPDPLPSRRGEPVIYRIHRSEPDPHLVIVARNGMGFTRASVYTGPYADRIRQIRNLFVVTASASLALTAVLGFWLTRQSLRPIAAITAAARRIRATPESGAIEVRGSGDELDALAITLNEMLERIRRSIERMRLFSAEAAHELRTPLASVQTRLEVTLAKARTPEEYRAILEETLADVSRLAEGVRSVLRLAHYEAGLEPGQAEAVPLRPLLESVAGFFQPIAEQRGVQLTLLPGGDRSVRGDRSWLERMFANLVDNAIKYSPPGGVVRIEPQADSLGVTVAVIDSGPGLAPATRERVFERFFRGRPQGEEAPPGSGIGLSLAQEIARAHSGTIELESEPGAGSTFRVRLPAFAAG